MSSASTTNPTPSPTVASNTSSSSSSSSSSKDTTIKKDNKIKFAVSMAFLTGIADISLNLKYKTFATMMTGNTMWMALAATEARYADITYYASVIVSYLTGLAIFRKTDLSLKKNSMKTCAGWVTALFIGSDVVFGITRTRRIPVMMLATGFGIVNSVGMEVAGTLTFVITGHLTKLTNQAFDRISRTAGRKKLTLKEKRAVKLNSLVFGGFFMGALCACVMKGMSGGSWIVGSGLSGLGLFSGLGVLYGLLFLWQDMESMDGAWWLRKNDEMCDLNDDGEACDIDPK